MNFFGPVNRLGMGVHFTCMVGAYIQRAVANSDNGNCGVFVSPKGPTGFSRKSATFYEDLVLEYTNPSRFNPNSKSMLFWHASDVSGFHGAARILYTVFETDRLSDAEHNGIKNVDAVIVPTEWHRDILVNVYEYKKPVMVVEAGASGVFSSMVGRWQGPFVPKDFPKDGLILSSVGKYEKRKGQREAIAALGIMAGSPGVPITLIANWINIFDPNWFNDVEGELAANGFTKTEKVNHSEMFATYVKGRCSIVVLQRPLQSNQDIANFYRASDYLLHPAFAEGWGLPITEAARCGIPVIAQRYGAMGTSVPNNPEILLSGDMVVANDGMFFHGDRGRWSQVRVESILQALDFASRNVRNQTWIGLSERSKKSTLSWATVAERLLIVLAMIP